MENEKAPEGSGAFACFYPKSSYHGWAVRGGETNRPPARTTKLLGCRQEDLGRSHEFESRQFGRDADALELAFFSAGSGVERQ